MSVDAPLQDRADVCVVACAEAFRGDGEILASAFGQIPRAGVALARLSFEPGLLSTNGEAFLLAEPDALGARSDGMPAVEGYMPFRRSFEYVWSGRRHAMMMAAQIDRFGNANLSAIGDWHTPRAQLVGVRGLPGNTLNHPCSYWVPRHSTRVFVDRVDMISGVGYHPSDSRGSTPFHEIRRIVTNLCVLDFDGPDNAARIASLHPGVTLDEVHANTGFELSYASNVPVTRRPTPSETRMLRERIDPRGLTAAEIAGS